MKRIILILCFALIFTSGFLTTADRLPKQIPENQIFSIDTLMQVTGMISEESMVDWTIDYQHLYLYYDDATNESVYDDGRIHDGKLNRTESIAIMQWQDDLRTSGGDISLSKQYQYNSKNRGQSLYNLKTDKVLTYNSLDGSHLIGSELWTLDVAGNYDSKTEYVRCVFADVNTNYFPAFCNVVKAQSMLINLNSGKISSKGASRAVASSTSSPASLNYIIAVTPDTNTRPDAVGTVKTMFGGSIMEAVNKSDDVSATNTWKDTATVTGGITGFQKKLLYDSGFSI